MNYQINEERLTADEYIEFLKRQIWDHNIPKNAFMSESPYW